ncbi:uncharacterized protein AKAW2_40924A [Aspergillus luchuensis]|uniref:Uncharacterized protein n=1 Tax=Aspergillus kawachii TaxID=1069201 RepID=A0A7R7WAB1_ASPKA|nr:uncharacterized protein AKAW2_40924A [Aspergillus luchuensis]BCR99241.1 hypothetical protein AKAW2_40924A [Aspergillus luchuensis]
MEPIQLLQRRNLRGIPIEQATKSICSETATAIPSIADYLLLTNTTCQVTGSFSSCLWDPSDPPPYYAGVADQYCSHDFRPRNTSG